MSCNVEQSYGCCSLLELSGFSNRSDSQSIIESLKFFYNDYIYSELTEEPRTMFATTRTKQQPEAEAALLALGFKPKKFKSRHPNEDSQGDLKFWWRNQPPPEVRKHITKLKREYRD